MLPQRSFHLVGTLRRYLTPESESDVTKRNYGITVNSRAKPSSELPNGHVAHPPGQLTPSPQQRKVAAIIPGMVPQSERQEYQYLSQNGSREPHQSRGQVGAAQKASQASLSGVPWYRVKKRPRVHGTVGRLGLVRLSAPGISHCRPPFLNRPGGNPFCTRTVW